MLTFTPELGYNCPKVIIIRQIKKFIMKAIHAIAFILLVIGGLNWLLVGIWGKDLFAMIGLQGTVATVVYVLVGLSAIIALVTHKKSCRDCAAPAQVI